MSRFRFWKKSEQSGDVQPAPVAVTRFNVTPRQDVRPVEIPGDAVASEKLARLGKRREVLVHEVESAQEASHESNRWRAEITLIEQAIGEIDSDIAALPASGGPAGEPVDPLPITLDSFQQEPVIVLTLRIGKQRFVLAEDLDWAERGFQMARSDLHIEEGDLSQLTAHPDLQEHLASSLIVYGSDVRDRLLEGQLPVKATLADLARPSSEFGGWLDWHGHSAFSQERALQLQGMRAERERLEAERTTLIAEEAKAAESLPFAQRRLAEVDAEIAALVKSS